jgi:uncharacterized protein (TIGR00369 family)
MHEILKKYNVANKFGSELGLELEVIRPGKVKYTLVIAEKHLSNPLAAHGGVVAAMMDGILGVAALSLAVETDRLVSTVEYKTSFFAPVELNDELEGIGEVIHQGNRLFSSEGSIICLNKENQLISKGLGTFNAYPVSKNSFLTQ